ncbi:MAG: hypothetical protein ACP5D2_00935 [Candidatus Nanoarchaeia archaeon]
MNDRFGLPVDRIIVFDTCYFGTSNYILFDWDEGNLDSLQEERARLSCLNRRLAGEHYKNWTVTQGVVEEFEAGNQKLGFLIKDTISQNEQSVLAQLLDEREHTLELIGDEYRVLEHNLPEDIIEKYRQDYTGLVNHIEMKGRNSYCRSPLSEVDKQIVLASLYLLEDDKVRIASYDTSLLNVFSRCRSRIKQMVA